MQNLLIDIGNSNIKTAIGNGKKIYKPISIRYSKKEIIPTFEKHIKSYKKEFNSIGICCLDKKLESIIRKSVMKIFGIKPNFVNSYNSLPIKIDYEKTLGNDRICSAIGALSKYNGNKQILVIDFGTATTYNLIINKVFKGGLITPGIQTCLNALNEKANLPLTSLNRKVRLITNKTKSNILSGIIHQSLYTTEGIIRKLKEENKNLFVVCTGGLSGLIFKKSKLINKYEKNLVLEGINFIQNNINK